MAATGSGHRSLDRSTLLTNAEAVAAFSGQRSSSKVNLRVGEKPNIFDASLSNFAQTRDSKQCTTQAEYCSDFTKVGLYWFGLSLAQAAEIYPTKETKMMHPNRIVLAIAVALVGALPLSLAPTTASADVGVGVHIGGVGAGAHVGIGDGRYRYHHHQHHCSAYSWRHHHRYCRRWRW